MDTVSGQVPAVLTGVGVELFRADERVLGAMLEGWTAPAALTT
jgi:hypothetical protein